ncbi:hypothetical protein ACH5RR_032863 [Cinchona calisaya]|uniref:Uncharacterized protein n=1 Tax=Cinchona calisaya TaxID=153742 RepID=A0ABD2YKN2_9GENT
MSYQNSEFCQQGQKSQNSGIESTALNLQAMFHLNSTAATTTTLNGGSHQQPTPLFPPVDHQFNKCGSTKRQSPSSFYPLQEPSSERATLSPPSSSTAAATFSGDHRILGFTKLPLPFTALRRTTSDLINSPGVNNLSEAMGNFLNNQLPESSAVNSAACSPSQPLYRSISDPTSASYQVVTTTNSTPPRPPAARQESPNTKRLKRMKNRLREMSQWWNEVIKEGEEDGGSEDNDSLPKDESEVSQVSENEGPCEEAVWVERNGECLILHFKCPCGKGYQILLNGKNCYYKLTAF